MFLSFLLLYGDFFFQYLILQYIPKHLMKVKFFSIFYNMYINWWSHGTEVREDMIKNSLHILNGDKSGLQAGQFHYKMAVFTKCCLKKA